MNFFGSMNWIGIGAVYRGTEAKVKSILEIRELRVSFVRNDILSRWRPLRALRETLRKTVPASDILAPVRQERQARKFARGIFSVGTKDGA